MLHCLSLAFVCTQVDCPGEGGLDNLIPTLTELSERLCMWSRGVQPTRQSNIFLTISKNQGQGCIWKKSKCSCSLYFGWFDLFSRDQAFTTSRIFVHGFCSYFNPFTIMFSLTSLPKGLTGEKGSFLNGRCTKGYIFYNKWYRKG